jgi:hypothetical protein
MAQVYNRLSTDRLFLAFQAAAACLNADVAEAAVRLSRRFLASTNDVRGSEHRSSLRQQIALRHLPGSAFEARYEGLTAQAAFIDAAICRRQSMR